MFPRPLESKHQYRLRTYRYITGYPNWAIEAEIRRLKNQGLIRKHSKYYILSNKGKLKILEKKLRSTTILNRNVRSCLIVFDVAETHRKSRRFIRRVLIDLGFINLQKSVMLGPNIFSTDFVEFITELKIRDQIKVLEVKIIF